MNDLRAAFVMHDKAVLSFTLTPTDMAQFLQDGSFATEQDPTISS